MLCILLSFFFNDTATTEIYTLSLHDALPIYRRCPCPWRTSARCALVHLARDCTAPGTSDTDRHDGGRSEEHTSELQSRLHLVCRLLLEKKKNPMITKDQGKL